MQFSQNKQVIVRALGRAEYAPTWQEQERLLANTVAQKVANRQRSAPEPTPNYFLLCEHPPVYTLGKSGHESHLLIDDATLQRIGATYHRTNRGGDITFHGPGQLVGYPVLDLDNFFTDIHLYMRTLEEVIIRTVAEYGLSAKRIEGLTGVWLDDEDGRTAGPPRKICAMGVKASRWVTMHGFALNVNTDLTYFDHIVPCGITDKAVTSLAAELGRPVPLDEVQGHILKHFASVFGAELVIE